MAEETIHYKDDPDKYMRVLEILLKNTEISINMIVQRATIITSFITVFIIPLISFLVGIVIPRFFENLIKLVSGNINLIQIAWNYISSGGIVNFILGVITLAITFVLNSTLILFIVTLLLLELLFFKNKRVQSKMDKWSGRTLLEKINDNLGQLNLAKYEPEKWDMVVDVDRDKKYITFIEIKRAITTDK